MAEDTLASPVRRIATAGIDLIDHALADQGVDSVRADWRPPSDPTLAPILSAIALSQKVAAANREALDRLVSARPHLVGVTTAAEAVGLELDRFLHSGPPIAWDEASGPLRGALIGAALLEGLAVDPDAAASLFAGGALHIEPCHHRGAVGPMAGVVSRSMPMLILEDSASGRRAYCTINEGLGRVLRFGAYADEVLDRLRWMSTVLAPVLDSALRAGEPIDVFAMVAEALQMGDECHNRNRAGTSLFLRALGPRLIESPYPHSHTADCFRFIAGNDHFFLNLMMPAAKVAADLACDVPGSTMVVAMARNGTEFGIRLSGTGDAWFTGPASVPKGLLFAGYGPEDANPDIGDSTITETVGVGGMAMAAAPAIVTFVGGSSELAMSSTLAMYDVTLGEHPVFKLPPLDFRGTPVGIDAALVVRRNRVPVVNTGIAGRTAGIGQVGAGLVDPPMGCFDTALRRFAELNRDALGEITAL